MSLETQEVKFKVMVGAKEFEGYLWRQMGGNWHVYIERRVVGNIIHYNGGWMVILNSDNYNQGDADELLAIAGIPFDEKYPIAGHVETQPAMPNVNAYKTRYTDCPIFGKEKSPD